jgi:hypothetical protein
MLARASSITTTGGIEMKASSIVILTGTPELKACP